MYAAPIDTPALWLGAITALAVISLLLAALLIVTATQAAAYRIRCHLSDRRHTTHRPGAYVGSNRPNPEPDE